MPVSSGIIRMISVGCMMCRIRVVGWHDGMLMRKVVGVCLCPSRTQPEER